MFIPGRVEVLGKHTDYCGGRSIVCAIDRGFHAKVEIRSDSIVQIENLDSGEKETFDLTDLPQKRGHWVDYAIEVGRRLTFNFIAKPLRGCKIRFRSDLPQAAGLSSSSAFMVMVFAALDAANDLRATDAYRENIYDDVDLAEYLGCIENGRTYRNLRGSAGVGTFGGSQDHAAILLGRPGTLTGFAFAPLRYEADLGFPDDLAFVIASSGIIAEKTGSALEKYNRVSRMASTITTSLGGRSLAALIDENGIDAIRGKIRTGEFEFSTEELLGRVEQFEVENYKIIPTVSDHLIVGEYDKIGSLVDLSQQNVERFLGNQVAETIHLQRTARELGALAASAFGAGFGGSVYAIVSTAESDEFKGKWLANYAARFPQHSQTSEFFVTRPSQIILS